MLDNLASLNAVDGDQQTPLHWAVDKEDAGMCQLLLTRKADVNAADSLRHTALHRAAALGLARVVRTLLERGADVNLKNSNGWTPVHVACYYAHKDIVALMLAPEHAPDVELANKDGWTALHCAAAQGHTEIAQLLLTHNAAINARAADQSTPLHAAVRGGHARTVKLLVSAGAAIALKDSLGRTPRQMLQFAPADRVAKTEAALPSESSSSRGTAVAASQRASASNSVAVGEGMRAAVAGALATFKIQVKNSRGRYVDAGGAHVSVQIRSGATQRAVNMQVKVSDNGDGTYSVTYTPPAAGVFALEVLLNKRHIAGSPFTLRVVPSTGVVGDAGAAATPTTATTAAATPTVAVTPAPPTTAATGKDGEHEQARNLGAGKASGSPRRNSSSSPRSLRGSSSPTQSPASTGKNPPLSPQPDSEASLDESNPFVARLHELDARHRRLLAEHAALLRQMKQQERAIRDDRGGGGARGAGGAAGAAPEAIELESLRLKSQHLAKAHAQLTAKSLCVVCKKNERDSVCTPCLHFQYCRGCLQLLTECVSCKRAKTGLLQVST